MNYKLLGRILGKIMILEGVLMLAPLAVSIIYSEGIVNNLAFAIPIFTLVLIGSMMFIVFLQCQETTRTLKFSDS